MDRTTVSVYFLPNRKEERYKFKKLEDVFSFIRQTKIKSKRFFSEFGKEINYIALQPNKSSQLGVVGQKLILEDGGEFIRKVGIRYDASGHGKTNPHMNLDLLTVYQNANKTEKDKLKQTHLLFFKNKGVQTLHVILSVPGSSIRRSVVILPTLKDKEYHEKQNIFLQKLKNGTLTEKDKIEFKNQSKDYFEYISNNKKI
ncbi:MAG TPA: hypothetical protein VI564_07050 [Candidatus Nanoarchaeia archaeon]|nr:hypothetical protein [Candidatus Nanoarchaeia archaeon]